MTKFPVRRALKFQLALFGVLLPLPGRGQPVPLPGLAITHVAVVDTENGAVRRDATVLIDRDRITDIVASGSPISGNRTVFDGTGRFLIPGLWDVHVHLSYARASALPLFIANGVTTVRDVGSNLPEVDDWRSRIGTGALVGPHILRAGPMLNGQSFNRYQIAVGTPDQARGIVRALKQVGVDFIKVHRRVPRDAYFAVAEECRSQGLILVGHIPMTVTPEEASDAGQLIEHIVTLFEGTFASGFSQNSDPLMTPELPAAIRAFRANGASALLARFARNRTFVTPTLRLMHAYAEEENGGLTPDRLRYVARSIRNFAVPPAEVRAARDRLYAECFEVVRLMSKAGIPLLAGTDTAVAPTVPGFFLQEELVALVEAGVSPLAALQAATLNPAKAMKREDDLGRVAPGKLADLVLLDGNPVEDIRNTQRIAAVVLRGKLLQRGELDALLKTAEDLADRN
ncbi:MAG: amidohydrolase family protein [Opitutaceae bacterium]